MHLREDDLSEFWTFKDQRFWVTGLGIKRAAGTGEIRATKLPFRKYPRPGQGADGAIRNSFIGGQAGVTKGAAAFIGLKEVAVQKAGVEERVERCKEGWIRKGRYSRHKCPFGSNFIKSCDIPKRFLLRPFLSC